MNTNILRQKYTGKNSITFNEKCVSNAIDGKDRKRNEQKNEELNKEKQNEDSDEGILVVNRTLKSKIFLEEKQTNKNEKSFIKKKAASIINIPNKNGKKEIISANTNDKKVKNFSATVAKKEINKINVISHELEQKERHKTYNINSIDNKLEKETIKNVLVNSKSKVKTRKETDEENQKKSFNEQTPKNCANTFLKINTRKEDANDKELDKDVDQKILEAKKEDDELKEEINEQDEGERNNIKENYSNSYNQNDINTYIRKVEKTNDLCNLNTHSTFSIDKNTGYNTTNRYLIEKKKSEDVAYFDEYIKQQNEETQNKKEIHEKDFLTENKFIQIPFKNESETKKTKVDVEKKKDGAETIEMDGCGKVIKYDNFALAEIDKELEKINEEENKIQEELVRLTDLELQFFLKKKNLERQKLLLERKNENEAKMKNDIENDKKEYQME